MTNPTYRRIVTNGIVRLECAVENLTYERIDGKVVVRAMDPDLFEEIETATPAAPGEGREDLNLESARRELANAIERAKTVFERTTGTVLEGVSVQIMKHISGVYTDCSAIMSVNVTATYNPEDGRGPTKWVSS